MIVANLQGGFANRLFIMAAAHGHAKKIGTNWAIRNYSANDFLALQYLNGSFVSTNLEFPKYQEKGFHYTPIEGDNIELWGYFQSEKYFSHCKDEITEMFQPIDELEKLIPKFKGDTCAIHVRRGDYLSLSDYHFNLQLDYYEAAMKLMGKKMFIVFSDDIEWCKNQPLFKGCKFYQGGDGTRTWEDLKDFYAMASCKNHIIANSTFSWWASWLSGSENIIAPKNWFGVKSKHDTKDLYTENMTVI